MRRKKDQTTGILQLGMSEKHPKNRLELLDEKYRPSEWWRLPGVSILLLIIFTTGDFSSIFMILSNVLTQNPFMLFLFSIVLCMLFNFLPVILARLIRLRQAGMINAPVPLLLVIPGAFILLIASVFYVRYATRELEFQTANLMQSVTAGVNQQPTNTPAALPMVYLMTALPLATSVVSFFISWMDNPLEQKAYKLEKRRLKLFENLVQLKAFTAECAVQQYQTRLLAENDAKYNASINMLEAEKNHLQDHYRAKLAEHLADPTSTSILSVPRTKTPATKPSGPASTEEKTKKQTRRKRK